MYFAQTNDSRHSFVPYWDEGTNEVVLDVFEGVVPDTSKEPVHTFRFNARESHDLERGLRNARAEVTKGVEHGLSH